MFICIYRMSPLLCVLIMVVSPTTEIYVKVLEMFMISLVLIVNSNVANIEPCGTHYAKSA